MQLIARQVTVISAAAIVRVQHEVVAPETFVLVHAQTSYIEMSVGNVSVCPTSNDVFNFFIPGKDW